MPKGVYERSERTKFHRVRISEGYRAWFDGLSEELRADFLTRRNRGISESMKRAHAERPNWAVPEG